MDRRSIFQGILLEYGYQQQQIDCLWDNRPKQVDTDDLENFKKATRLTAQITPPSEAPMYQG